MTKHRVTVLFGTRPEAIKLAPVVRELQARGDRFETTVLSTGQHRDMLKQVLGAFGLSVDHDLDVMRDGGSLSDLTSSVISGLAPFLAEQATNTLLVQGDTTSAFIGALAAFYHKVAVGHIEAGLRTYDMTQPFPEEANRRMLSVLADVHFAPCDSARENLLRENIPADRIFVTGNTGIDAMLWMIDQGRGVETESLKDLDPQAPLVLVTAHRRENLGEPLLGICEGLRRLAAARPELQFVFAVHPNPKVRDSVHACLGEVASMRLVEALPYPDFVALMARSRLIVSDSGGVQEEAPTLGVPVLVTRNVTERVDAERAGTVLLTGTDPERICSQAVRLLEDEDAYNRMASRINPYGDGKAAGRAVDVLAERLSGR